MVNFYKVIFLQMFNKLIKINKYQLIEILLIQIQDQKVWKEKIIQRVKINLWKLLEILILKRVNQ